MKYLYLSHPLSAATPLYGGQGAVEIVRQRSMAAGDNSNSTALRFPAHAGTHIDAPFHFDERGATLDHYGVAHWHCMAPFLIELSAEPGEIIGMQRLAPSLDAIPSETDLLLIRTGFERWRETATMKRYAAEGPGLHPDVGTWLRRNRSVRIIGFDFISLSSYKDPTTGREAHRAFLGGSAEEGIGSPIMIIEDMRLSGLVACPREVWVVPLIVDDGDGAPATIIAVR